MKQNNFELYQDAAKHVCPDATSIEMPNVSGIQKNVFFVHSDRGVTVLKFNARPVIEKMSLPAEFIKVIKFPPLMRACSDTMTSVLKRIP